MARIMPRSASEPCAVTKAQGRRIWLGAQRLDTSAPFGNGPDATPAAVAHLGYVQIDTINVVERSHHQILYTRIPTYRREHLRQAQSVDKSVFEYWTHALSYVPTADLRFRRNEQVRVEIPTASSEPVTARLLDRTGKALAVPVTAAVRDDPDGSRWVTAQLTLAPLAPADYAVELTVGERKMISAFRVIQ